MRTTIRHHAARLFAPALAIVLVLGVGGLTQAACYDPAQQLPVRVVSQFINEPGKLLTQFPSGGPQMISLVRDLVASDPGTLALITELNTKANADQVRAIGTGLGQATLVCARTAQAFADEIQRVTIAANNAPMTEAFGAVVGDQFLGLAAPAVGGGGSGATGQVGSTGGTTAAGIPLNLTTSVSQISNPSTTARFGITPSLTVGVSSGGESGSASAGTVTPLAGSLSGAVSAGNSGSLFAGNQSGSIFGTGPASSRAPNILGTVNTANVTANISTNVNSAISVSPSRPR